MDAQQKARVEALRDRIGREAGIATEMGESWAQPMQADALALTHLLEENERLTNRVRELGMASYRERAEEAEEEVKRLRGVVERVREWCVGALSDCVGDESAAADAIRECADEIAALLPSPAGPKGPPDGVGRTRKPGPRSRIRLRVRTGATEMAAQADDDRATGTRLEGSAGKPQTAKPSGPLRDTSDPDHRPSLQLHPNREADLRAFAEWLENYRQTYAWYIEHPDTQTPEFVKRTKALLTGIDAAAAEFSRRFPHLGQTPEGQ